MDAGGRIVAFYEGNAPDDRGRLLAEILGFDDDALERVHDFIQWLFPLRDRSGANPSAPRLDDATIATFATRPELRAGLRRSLERMLAFYGLRWDGRAIVKGPSFASRAGWLTPENHNHLRLTRILKSLRLLGEEDAARALFACLTGIVEEDARYGRVRVTARSYRFWSAALEDD